MHAGWDAYLRRYAEERGLPQEYVDMGFWRWKVLPPKMRAIAERRGLDLRPKSSPGPSMKVLKGASSCAAGGFSAEAVVTVPRSRPFVSVEDALRTIGEVRCSEEYEIAMVRCRDGTAKLFGGGQVSVVSKTEDGASRLFERTVKALLRAQMCTSCGICAKRCPKGAVRVDDGLHVDPRLCTSCGICEGSCMVAHYYDKLLSLPSPTREDFLNAAGVTKSVVITPEVEQNVVLSARNIPGVVTTTARILSVYDIVNAKQLVIDKAALAIIEEVYA